MDKDARGQIEQAIDRAIQEGAMIRDAFWVQDVLPITSLEDLILGYAIGRIERYARGVLSETGDIKDEDKSEIIDIIRRRIPEIREKLARELSR